MTIFVDPIFQLILQFKSCGVLKDWVLATSLLSQTTEGRLQFAFSLECSMFILQQHHIIY